MAGWAGMTAGAKALSVAAGVIFLGGAGYLVWQASRPPVAAPEAANVAAAPADTGVSETPAAEAPAAEPSATDAAAAEETTADAPAVAEAEPPASEEPAAEVAQDVPEPLAPALDVVRIAPDGETLIAGRTEASAKVAIRLDGVDEMVTQADGNGNFVAQMTLAPNPAARLLTVVALLSDGTELPGSEQIAVAPIAPPPAAAEPPAPELDAGAEVAAGAEAEAETEAAADATPPAAVVLTEEGPEVLPAADTPPEILANVSVDSIGYTADGRVQLGGRGAPGSVVRVYLDNSAIADAPVGLGGTWALTPDIAPGIYTLRVDQLASDGSVTSRFETPFKRETLEALAAATSTAEPPAGASAPTDAPSVTETTATTADQASDSQAADATQLAEAPVTEAPATEAPATEAAVTDVDTEAAEAAADIAPETPQQEATAEPATTAAPAVTEVVEPSAPAAEVQIASEAPAVEAPVAPTAEPLVVEPAAPAEPVPEDEPVVAEAAVAELPTAEPAPAARAAVTITVQPGFTLWGIADDMMGDGLMYVQVFDANRDKIKDPDLIYPGQVFTLPASP